MPFLPSLEDDDQVPHALAKFQNGTQIPLLEFHEALLRGNSEFSVKERELMAAFVSGVNACQYCHGAHSSVAREFGVSESTMIGLLEDIESADVDEKLKPVLAYISKLTSNPTRMTQADADAVFDAGWSEQALYDAVQVCCLFNFMNRFVEGLGLIANPLHFGAAGQRIKQNGYSGIAKKYGIK